MFMGFAVACPGDPIIPMVPEVMYMVYRIDPDDLDDDQFSLINMAFSIMGQFLNFSPDIRFQLFYQKQPWFLFHNLQFLVHNLLYLQISGNSTVLVKESQQNGKKVYSDTNVNKIVSIVVIFICFYLVCTLFYHMSDCFQVWIYEQFFCTHRAQSQCHLIKFHQGVFLFLFFFCKIATA